MQQKKIGKAESYWLKAYSYDRTSATTLRNLGALYDRKRELVKAKEFYKGDGILADRMIKYAEKRTIPKKSMKNYFIKALNIAKKRTQRIFKSSFPIEEKVNVVEQKIKSGNYIVGIRGDLIQ